MKEKLKSYEFWVSVFSAVLVVLQTLSTKINIPHTTEIMTAFLGALCVVGILKKKPSTDEETEETGEGNNAQDTQSQDNTSQYNGEEKK